MKVIETDIRDVLILEPKIFTDERGYFYETYNQKDFNSIISEKIGYTVRFVQDNESKSSYGVVRGLHFQNPPYSQSKLVRCLYGKVLDVAVDLRKASPTYGKHIEVELTGENKRQLFIPRGFAHGFSVLSEVAVFQYKCDNFYAPGNEGGISLFDPSLNISWGIPREDLILSDKDGKYPLFEDFNSPFEYYDMSFKKLK